jgi:hypothetical protein
MDTNPKHEKASKKAGKILRELDVKELEQVNGGFCLACGLIMSPEFPPLPRPGLGDLPPRLPSLDGVVIGT